MPDYQELYQMLFRATERAIQILIDAQRICEEKYLMDIEQDDDAVKGPRHCLFPPHVLQFIILVLSGGAAMQPRSRRAVIVLDAVADAFVAARLGDDRGFEYGTLDSQTTLGAIKSLQISVLENQGVQHGWASPADQARVAQESQMHEK